MKLSKINAEVKEAKTKNSTKSNYKIIKQKLIEFQRRSSPDQEAIRRVKRLSPDSRGLHLSPIEFFDILYSKKRKPTEESLLPTLTNTATKPKRKILPALSSILSPSNFTRKFGVSRSPKPKKKVFLKPNFLTGSHTKQQKKILQSLNESLHAKERTMIRYKNIETEPCDCLIANSLQTSRLYSSKSINKLKIKPKKKYFIKNIRSTQALKKIINH